MSISNIKFYLSKPRLWAILLSLCAVTGVFARGLVNIFFAILFLRGLIYLITNGFKHSGLCELPRRYWLGVLLFATTYLAASLAGTNPPRSLGFVVLILYLLSALPLAYLSLKNNPDLLDLLPWLYGLGLLVCGFMTYREASYSLVCLRAKASLGVIELAAVLAQLTPIALASLIDSISQKKILPSLFFTLALLASLLSIHQNCSRITMLVVPISSILIFWVYRSKLKKIWRLGLPCLLAIILATIIFSPAISQRFTDIGKMKENVSNHIRLTLWSYGWQLFKEHPLLGYGPTAIPRLSDEILKIDRPSDAPVPSDYGHTHHVFINSLAESGLIGFLGLLALHLLPLSFIWPYRKSQNPKIFFWVWASMAVSLQFFLNGLTDQIFSLKPMMYIYWTVTGAAFYAIIESKKSLPDSFQARCLADFAKS